MRKPIEKEMAMAMASMDTVVETVGAVQSTLAELNAFVHDLKRTVFTVRRIFVFFVDLYLTCILAVV